MASKLEASRSEAFSTRSTNFSLGQKTEASDVKSESKSRAYSAEKNIGKPIKVPLIFKILGNTWVSIGWDVTMGALGLLNFFVSTYDMFFVFTSYPVQVLKAVIDVIFFLELMVRIVIEFMRYKGSHECIVFFQPTTLSFWFLEVVATFPIKNLLIFLVNQDDLNDFVNVGYGRVLTLFRGLRIFMFLGRLREEDLAPAYPVFVAKFFLIYVILLQLMSCFWIRFTGFKSLQLMNVGSESKWEAMKGTWLEPNKIDQFDPGFKFEPLRLYVLCLYFSTSILATLGYGDIIPRSEAEYLASIVVMLFGAIGLAGYFGSVLTSFLLERDGARYDMFHRVQYILDQLKRMNASKLFLHKTEEYYRLLWNYREGVYNVRMMKTLPHSMQDDILYDICTQMFHKAILFRNLGEPFLRAVSREVEVVLYNPDMIVCQQGSYALTMYYIIHGEVLVKSKQNSNMVSAVLRTGCVFGESSLLFSYPYPTNIETKNCCQMLRLSKERLMKVLSMHYYALTIMRNRIQLRVNDVRRFYEMVGKKPITWVQFKQDGEFLSEKPYHSNRTVLRWATGLNKLVDEDVVDDTGTPVIVDMPCQNKKLERGVVEAYKNSTIPNTLESGYLFVDIWHILMLVLTTLSYVLAFYNIAFAGTSEISYHTEKIMDIMSYVNAVLYVIDVGVEILTASPATGLYYKFFDGLAVCRSRITFYLDVITIIPVRTIIDILDNNEHSGYSLYAAIPAEVFPYFFKLIKVSRYVDFLDNRHTMSMFWIRLVCTAIRLLIGVHTVACLMFFIACPPYHKPNGVRQCYGVSWLSSYYLWKSRMNKPHRIQQYLANSLANSAPYLLSLHFAVATWTTAGFGDFAATNMSERMFIVCLAIFGVFTTGYYTAMLTSSLACSTRPKLSLEQKLVSVDQFLDESGLKARLRERILEHYVLQSQYAQGIILPKGVKHFMFDAPPYLQDDALYMEVFMHLEGIPIFSKADHKVIIHMAKLMDRYVLPPNIYFIRRGDVRRQMYVVFRGSLAVLKEETNEVKAILEASSHIGIRDLLFGEPSHNNVKTLSYCVIYAIDLKSFMEAMGRDSEFMSEAERQREKNAEIVSLLTKIYSHLRKARGTEVERKPSHTPSWIEFPTRKNSSNNVCDLQEYEVPFRANMFTKFMKFFLMRRTVHPAGAFAIYWNVFVGFSAICIMVNCAVEIGYVTLGYEPTLVRMAFGTVLLIDMYVKMHWAYFTEGNLLVSHPLKTARNFFCGGTCIFGYICTTVPYEVILVVLRVVDVGYFGDGYRWVGWLRLVTFFNLFRLPVLLVWSRNILKRRMLILTVWYVWLVFAVCTMLTSISFWIDCPVPLDPVRRSDIEKLPACLARSWINSKRAFAENTHHFSTRWTAGMYFVTQNMFLIGSGELLDRLENLDTIRITVAQCLLGFLVIRCVVADLTASAVDTDAGRAVYVEKMKVLETIMTREGVNKKMINNVIEYMKNTWALSNGLQPQQVFDDLHPALQSDVFREFIGDALTKTPLFRSIKENVARIICQYLKKYYFSQGERLMRCGNIEAEMHVIVDGEVWITTETDELECVLGPGETFGETEMLFGGRRRYSAVAMNDVEVFTLSSADFSRILLRYPSLQADMFKIMGAKRDLFERKLAIIKGRLAQMGEQDQLEVIQQQLHNNKRVKAILRSHLPYEYADSNAAILAAQGESFSRFIKTKIVGSGNEDYGLPFLYFASSPIQHKCRLLIHPNCLFYKIVKILTMFSCLMSAAIGFFALCFGVEFLHQEKLKNQSDYVSSVIAYVDMSNGCEYVYYLHILLSFVVPFPTVSGKFCKSSGKVAAHYVLSFSRFLVDLISSVPLTHLSFEVQAQVRPLYILRCLRLIHYLRTLAEYRRSITISMFVYKLSITVPFFLLTAHAFACILYAVAPCDLHEESFNLRCRSITQPFNETNRSWTASYYALRASMGVNIDESFFFSWRWYVRALYWVVTIMSTTGFGDLTATNILEAGIVVAITFCGAFLLSNILSQFTSAISSLTRSQREYLYQARLLGKYLKNIGLASTRNSQVLLWFHQFWKTSRCRMYPKATSVLPTCLRIDVNFALYKAILQQVALFQGSDIAFLRRVADRLTYTLYLDGTDIQSEGDNGDTLYIVYKGRVAGYKKNASDIPILVRWYDPGHSFGRYPALFYDQTYSKSYRAEKNAEVLKLQRVDLFYLAQSSKMFARRLQNFIKQKYSLGLPGRSIFHDVASKTFGKRQNSEFGGNERSRSREANIKNIMRGVN